LFHWNRVRARHVSEPCTVFPPLSGNRHSLFEAILIVMGPLVCLQFGSYLWGPVQLCSWHFPLRNFVKYSSLHVFKMSEWEKYNSLAVEFLGKTNCSQYSVNRWTRSIFSLTFQVRDYHPRSHVKDEECSSLFQEPL